MTLAVIVGLNPDTTYRPPWKIKQQMLYLSTYTLSPEIVFNLHVPLSLLSLKDLKGFPAYFSPFSSAEACEKSSRWLWKESWVSTDQCEKARKRHDMTLAVIVGLNPDTTYKPTWEKKNKCYTYVRLLCRLKWFLMCTCPRRCYLLKI